MDISAQQKPKERVYEFTKIEIVVPRIRRAFLLDLDFAAILDWSRQPQTKALDFLVIAAIAYGIDKIVARKLAADNWTRRLNVTIPVWHATDWNHAADALAESISFLTGDIWNFEFIQAEKPFSKPRKNRRKLAKGFPNTPVVSLLSGGIDSFVGALDLLADHSKQRLLFVSHYDRHVTGPAKQQENLIEFLKTKFKADRISHFQVRVGVVPIQSNETKVAKKYKFETSFRSRSLIFLGLAVFAASSSGENIPIVISENGPIALNMPLNPSRRGACSTRTVHPFFLSSLQHALNLAGIKHPIINPYETKTKGELIKNCRYVNLVRDAIELSNSCGRAGRKTYWNNRKAHACGTCVPCLLRRASLHSIGADTEIYGNEVFSAPPEKYPDFHALLGLIRQDPSQHEIQKRLLSNGRLPMNQLADYASVVKRMIDEVAQWLRDKAPKKICRLAGIRIGV